MPCYIIRSTLFNIAFFIVTLVSCLILLPTLLLPRKIYLFTVHIFVTLTHWLEKYILGLDFEVRGRENLPLHGPYLIAAKHQSAYETTKLHILFNDPAIVLKRELLWIPIWGWFLAKSDVIAIDRSTAKRALGSIQDGAKRMAAQGREIVIFPQGTRVYPSDTPESRPYKIGIVRMQEATGLPIIPMALNTGIFSPRNSWFKRPGRVIFEFLPPIPPGPDAGAILKKLEQALETKSNALMEEARVTPAPRMLGRKILLALLVLSGVGYTANWFFVADQVKRACLDFVANVEANSELIIHRPPDPEISGFPGRLTVSFGVVDVETQGKDTLKINSLQARSWPFLNMPIELETGTIAVSTPRWAGGLDFDSFHARATYIDNILELFESRLRKGTFEGRMSGAADFNVEPYPLMDFDLEIENHAELLTELAVKQVIEPKAALLAGVALTAMQSNGVARTKITRDGNAIYLGPLKVAELPE